MATASDIRAGGAYIELGMKDAGLASGLAAAEKQVEAFRSRVAAVGETLTSWGTRMMAAGGAVTAAFGAAYKQFADFGEDIGKLQAKTGMSSGAIQALGAAADKDGIQIRNLSGAFRAMFAAIADPSKEALAAFETLGIDLAELRALKPEQQFGQIADRLAEIQDVGKRSALTQAVLGSRATELMPLLEGGSGRLNAEYARLVQTGRLMGDAQVEAAKRADDALDDLGQAWANLARQVGGAVADKITPWVEKLSGVMDQIGGWVKANPDTIQWWLDAAAGVTALGAAFLALGTAITVAMSPALVIAAALTGLGALVLAVTDGLGLTSTGFRELADSIRIAGSGLGTWLTAAFQTAIQYGTRLLFLWETMDAKIRQTDLENALAADLQEGEQRRDTLIEAIDQTAPGSQARKNAEAAVLAQDAYVAELRDRGDRLRAKASRRVEDIAAAADRAWASADQRVQATFAADAGKGQWGVDRDAAAAGIARIGANLRGAAAGLTAGMAAALDRGVPGANLDEFPEIVRAIEETLGIGGGPFSGKLGRVKPPAAAAVALAEFQPPRIGAQGQFGGANAWMAGGPAADRLTRATERSAKHLAAIEKNTARAAGGGETFQ